MRDLGDRTDTAASADPQMFVRTPVGRIIEVRVRLLTNRTDVEQLSAAVWAALRRVGSGAVICADYRSAGPLTSEIATLWSTAMRRTNGSIVRSALLLDSSNTLFNLQMARVVRCSANEQRRLFEDEQELRRWLADALTDCERDGLRSLFSSLQRQAGGIPGDGSPSTS